jgi:hypothetical protein
MSTDEMRWSPRQYSVTSPLDETWMRESGRVDVAPHELRCDGEDAKQLASHPLHRHVRSNSQT